MAKLAETEESGKLFGILRRRKKAGRKEKQTGADRGVDNNNNTRNGAEATAKRKTLQE